MLQINTKFSAGNISVVSQGENSQPIILSINRDNESEFFQWFYFKVNNALDQNPDFIIENAGEAAYPDGWQDYQVCCSYDGIEWFRISTQYKDGRLQFSHTFARASAYFAYFPPYSYERHLSFVQQVATWPNVDHKVLGETIDGREINLLIIGNKEAKTKVWLTARQHPGETMAEWFMEGFIERLLDRDDAASRDLLERAQILMVPNMNPDGSERGHLRTNAVGINLNREWDRASVEKSPEVFFVRKFMMETGVDVYFDIHGDEGLPYVFLAGSEGVPRYDEDMAYFERAFIEDFKIASKEFQDQYGYPKDGPGEADLSIASSWVAETFGCLSMTLEMPFKDNANLPDPIAGWSDSRSIKLGASFVTPLLEHVIRKTES